MSVGETKGHSRHQRIKFKAHRTRNNNPCDSCRSRKRCCERINEEHCALCIKASKKCTFRYTKDKYFRYDRGDSVEHSQDANSGRTSARDEVVLPITDGDLPDTTFDNAPKPKPCGSIKQESVSSHSLEFRQNEGHRANEAGSNSPNDSPLKQQVGQIDVLEKVFQLYGNEIIDLYMAYVNPFMPIISWRQFHNFLTYGTKHKWRSFPSIQLGPICLRSLPYWSRDPKLRTEDPPDKSDIAAVSYDLALKEFLNVSNDEDQNVPLLQSCLIQIPFYISEIKVVSNPEELVMVSKLFSICHYLVDNLRLDADFMKRELNNIFKIDSECFYLNNIWWAFYIEEKWFCFLTNKQTTIYDMNFTFLEDVEELPNISSFGLESPEEVSKDTRRRIVLMKKINHLCWPYFVNVFKITALTSEVQKYWYSIIDYKFEKHGLLENLSELKCVRDQCSLFLLKIDKWWNELGRSCGDTSTSKHGHHAKSSLRLYYESSRVLVFKILAKKFLFFSLLIESMIPTAEESRAIEDFCNMHRGLSFTLIEFFKEKYGAFQAIAESSDKTFLYPFTNFQLSMIVIFLSLFNLNLFKSQNLFVKFEDMKREVSTIWKVYKSILGARSAHESCLLPASVLDILPYGAVTEASYDIIRKYRFSGIVNDHAIEPLLMSALPKYIIVEKETNSDLGIGDLTGLKSTDIERIDDFIEDFLTR
ncbi:Piso0_002343 [Millerozyma farinosa CBS 7064]|uniref:Piso0_002343 protein n=1 Tax=Pichia sorbitophila (strain ATCC MYA-4447 / BCRC 22081 / CBS 7064 / NBRC 10061 / NRRL Y-12695) TaxID=559304 RepID=G8YCD0_PICSO|nr:Piso0_002343 [Millerozyma farinosa CBS 7064]